MFCCLCSVISFRALNNCLITQKAEDDNEFFVKEEDIEEDYVDSDFDADENEPENNDEGQNDDEETKRKRNVKRGVFTKAYKVT